MNMGSYLCCSGSKLSGDEFNTISTTLNLISEESRLRLLCLLCNGEHCVSEILPHLSMSQSLVSHHLRDLKDADIVIDRKDGKRVFYSLTKYGGSIAKTIFGLSKTKQII